MTRTGFNLIDDKWIPTPVGLVSVREALLNGHNLTGWPCADPGTAEMVIRLLVPMAYRITGLDSPDLNRREIADRQGKLLAAERLDPNRVREYLAAHHHRFWLTGPPDGQPPFAQDPELAAVDPHPVAKAVQGWASGNNPTLGPHAPTATLSPAAAACQLLVLRGYSSGGLHTKHPVFPGKGKFVGSPLRRTLTVHPVGATLARTLIGHLVPNPHDTAYGEPFWEQPLPTNPVAPHTTRAGLLAQIAVRQDKTMLLRSSSDGLINGFTIAEGPGTNAELACEDPYLLVGSDFEPVKPKPGRAIWREAEALLTVNDVGNPQARAAILDWAIDADGGAASYSPDMFSWAVVSHHGDKSKDLDWSCANFPRLLHIFDRDAARGCLDYLHSANQAESTMCKQIAKVWHSAEIMPLSPNQKSEVYAPALTEFWARAEAGFWETADTPNRDPESMKDHLRSHALAGYDKVTAPLTGDRRTHMMVVESRRWLELWGRSSYLTQPDRQEAE